jgi:hypothetical protein
VNLKLIQGLSIFQNLFAFICCRTIQCPLARIFEFNDMQRSQKRSVDISSQKKTGTMNLYCRAWKTLHDIAQKEA